jgi:phage-related minor tail protein
MEANAAPQKDKPDNRTAAQKRRAEFQEQQREYLRGLGLMQQIQSDLDGVSAETVQVAKLKIETRLKLLGKILPDVKEAAIELTGADGGPIETVSKIERVIADPKVTNP